MSRGIKKKVHNQLKQSQNKSVDSSKNNQKKIIWFSLAAILLITYLIYSKVVKYPFLITWDDNLYITQNPDIISLSWSNVKLFFTKFYANNYQPLTMLFYSIEFTIGHGDASIFHIDNILLHIINTFLVFTLIKRISPKNILVALITAAFFAVHPMHVESVAWIAERKDVLYSFFFLIALILYLDYLKSEKLLHLVLSGVFFILSCLSKSAAVIFPVVMLLLDYYTNRKYSWKMILQKIPFFAISFLFGLFAIHSQRGSIQDMAPNMSNIEHVLIIAYSYISYIFKVFIPINLSAFYPYPIELGNTLPIMYYISIFCVALFLLFVCYSLKWGKDVVFGVLFFSVTIILVLQIFPVGAAIMADRYTYIPYIGLFFIIGKLFEFLYNNNFYKNHGKYKRYMIIILMFGFISFSLISYTRVELWQNDEVFFSEIIGKYPHFNTSYRNRGSYYLEYCALKVYSSDNTKRDVYIKKAMKDFESFLKYSIKNTDKSIANHSIGVAKFSQGDFDSAIQYYSKSIELDSFWSKPYSDRGYCYLNYYANQKYANSIMEKGKYIKKAIGDFESYIKYSSDTYEKAMVYYNLGCAKFDLKDFVGSVDCFDSAIKIDDNYSDAYNNRGSAKNILKDYKGAINDFNKVISFNPQNGIAYFNRGVNKYAINDYVGAIADFDNAINFYNNLALAYNLRGNAKQKLQKYKSALDDFITAIKLNPQDVNSIMNRDLIKKNLDRQ